MNVGELRVVPAWESGTSKVALNGQGTIARISQLGHMKVRPWIARGEIRGLPREEPRNLMWIIGNNGTKRQAGWQGRWDGWERGCKVLKQQQRLASDEWSGFK